MRNPYIEYIDVSKVVRFSERLSLKIGYKRATFVSLLMC